MQLLRLGQLYNATDLAKEQKVELAKKIDASYSIPSDTYRNLQEKSYAGYNCLHIAALKLDCDFICELLDHGADSTKQGTDDGKTPLRLAVNVIQNSKSRQVWEISGKLQDCQVVDTLLLTQVNSNNPLNPKCNNGVSHLHIACMFNCAKAVQFFLKKGEPINQFTNPDAHWPMYTPLHFAIRYSSVGAAEVLLDNGADLFAKDAEGSSPLDILISRILNVADYINMGEQAICLPYEEELRRLETIVRIVVELQSGNGLNTLDDTGLTTFHVACALRDSSIAASFLNDGLDLNIAVNPNSKFWPGWTPLHFAACTSTESVKLLMQKGADITIKNKKGETPFEFCLKRYTPVVLHSILSTREEFKNISLSDHSTKLLDLILAMNNITSFYNYFQNLVQIDIAVNPTSPLLPGYSILHLAVSMNERMKSWDDFLSETDTQEYLSSPPAANTNEEDKSLSYSNRIRACLTVGCSVDQKNCDGLTPIHLAIKTGVIDSDILEELLNNSQENVADPDNLSHLHIACAVGSQRAITVLLDSGADVNATTKKSFQWYLQPDPSADSYKPYLIRVNANSTPLHLAVAFGHADVVEILLSNGADVYATNSEGFTPIHLLMLHSDCSERIAEVIFGRPEELIDLVTEEGLSHLHVAAFVGDAAAIETLIRHGAIVNRSISVEVPDLLSRFAGKTPLQIATQFSRGNVAQAVRVLIESGADIYANDTLQCLMGETDVDYSQYFVDRLKFHKPVRKPIDSSGLTLLHVACSQFDVDWTLDLLERGVNVDAKIRDDKEYTGRWKGYTPLHALVSRENFDCDSKAKTVLKSMLFRRASVTIDSVDGTPLHVIYRKLTKKREEESSPETESRLPPVDSHYRPGLLLGRRTLDHLWQSHQRGALAMPMPMRARLLAERMGRDAGLRRLRQGIEPNVPSHRAPVREKLWENPLASLLLESQESYRINPIGPNGLSHFHFFCMKNNEAVVKLFLENGVDINHSTNPFGLEEFAGYTALHFAIKYETYNLVKMLVERGADVNIEDAEGNTPFHLMIMQDGMNKQRKLISSFQSHGADFTVKNVRGESPADVLMTKEFNLHQLQYFLANGSSINMMKSSSLPEPAALIMQNAPLRERLKLLKLYVNICDVKEAMKSGYSPIQDLVKAKVNVTSISNDDYLNIILEFMGLGCDLEQLDEKGCTALHNSITHHNVDAVDTLLRIGADVNACSVYKEFFIGGGKPEIQELIAYQAHKMHMLGLEVSEACNSIYREFRSKVAMKGDTELFIDLELETARSVKFTKTVSAESFLSETWINVHYLELSLADRQNIDNYFKNVKSLINQFPELCGIMLTQYNKARVRPKLVRAAVEVLGSECEIDLPDPCLEWIASFMSNDHLKYLIRHSEQAQSIS